MNTRKYKFTSNPGDGDASQLGIGEAEEESTSPTLFEHVFSLFPSYKANDSAERKNYKFTLVSLKNAYILYNSLVNPGCTEVFACQLHKGVEPLPESKVSLRQRLFAELGPSEEQVGCILCTSKAICFH